VTDTVAVEAAFPMLDGYLSEPHTPIVIVALWAALSGLEPGRTVCDCGTEIGWVTDTSTDPEKTVWVTPWLVDGERPRAVCEDCADAGGVHTSATASSPASEDAPR
jgi:hypothetical protein